MDFVLLIYNLGLKDFLISKFAFRETIDKIYYTNIFSNFDLAISIYILLCIILLMKYRAILDLINRTSIKYVLLFCLIISSLLQILFIPLFNTQPISDSVFYITLGERLYQTNEYKSNYGHFTAYWPVGLPFLLMLLHHVTSNIITFYKLFAILISLGTINILYRIFKDELSENQLKFFLLAWTFFPNNLLATNVILTDYIFLFLLFLACFILLKTKFSSLMKLVIIGVLIGLSSYFRPTGLLLPLLFGISYYKRGVLSAVKNTLIISIFVLITLSPWIVRNYMVFGSFVPVATNGGYNFLMGNHETSTGALNFNFRYDHSNPDEPLEDRRAYLKGMGDSFNNPAKTLIRLPKKILISYLRGDSSITWAFKKSANTIPPLIISLFFIITNLTFYNIILISLFTFFRKKTLKFKSNYIWISLFTYFIILILIYVGGERYIIPILPLHFLYFAKYCSSISISLSS